MDSAKKKQEFNEIKNMEYMKKEINEKKKKNSVFE